MPSIARLTTATLLAAAATLAAATTVVGASAPAHADADLLVCTGTHTAQYTPPLGPLPRQTTVEAEERLGDQGGQSCVAGPFSGGVGTGVFHQQASCLLPSPGGTLPEPNVVTYQWDNGEQSTITFTFTLVTRGVGQTLIATSGTVTEGFGEGAPAQRVKVLFDPDLLRCLFSHADHYKGPMILTIT